MKYIVFITENEKCKIKGNNRTYLGISKTENLDVFDGYLGDGVYITQSNTFMYPKSPFQCAVKKYGVKSFKRTIIGVYDNINDAVKYYKSLEQNFISQPHTYNFYPLETSTFYQFDLKGNLKHKWKYGFQACDFYSQSICKFKFMIFYKHEYLNSYWSKNKNIDINEFNSKINPKPMFLYSPEGKLIYQGYIEESVLKKLNITKLDLKKYIQNQMLFDGKYYISNKLIDLFISKPRANYLHTKIYVYEKDKGFLGAYIGKSIMKVINLHSWRKIKNALTINNGWYKDFYLSLTPILEIPEKVAKGIKIDVYDKYGNFIETMRSVNKTREKYNIPAAKFKDIQTGDKYYNDFIFKYHSNVK